MFKLLILFLTLFLNSNFLLSQNSLNNEEYKLKAVLQNPDINIEIQTDKYAFDSSDTVKLKIIYYNISIKPLLILKTYVRKGYVKDTCNKQLILDFGGTFENFENEYEKLEILNPQEKWINNFNIPVSELYEFNLKNDIKVNLSFGYIEQTDEFIARAIDENIFFKQDGNEISVNPVLMELFVKPLHPKVYLNLFIK